jgi:hypothetical protein
LLSGFLVADQGSVLNYNAQQRHSALMDERISCKKAGNTLLSYLIMDSQPWTTNVSEIVYELDYGLSW